MPKTKYHDSEPESEDDTFVSLGTPLATYAAGANWFYLLSESQVIINYSMKCQSYSGGFDCGAWGAT